jgi:Arc/MetJ-type ribon-helix-helix transcriptional regulator
MIEELDLLVGLGYFTNRSEAIRQAISVMLMTIKMYTLNIEPEGR